jgi:AcrR family transcriptional regulator
MTAVERADERLVRAAGDLIVEVGPRAATVRAIAARAGVNHGLVHHYFRSKDELLRAAMVKLVEEHRNFVKTEGGGDPLPPPMLLLEQRRYLRAVAHCVLDDELDLALLEVTEGLSVPRAAFDHLRASRGGTADVELKAAMCAAMALEMGWVLLEPFIFAVAEVEADDVSKARHFAARLRTAMAEVALS